MDAGDRFVPIVEDDQGEGYKDLVEELTIGFQKSMSIGDNVLEHFLKPTETSDIMKAQMTRMLGNRRGR